MFIMQISKFTKMLFKPLFFMIFFTSAAMSGAMTYYVDSQMPDDSGVGTDWTTAKRTLQAAVDLTVPGDTVTVAAGTYNEGGKVVAYLANQMTLTNRVAITQAITLQAASTNPADTIIVGASDNGGAGPAAVRCVYLAEGAVLSGFTLTNGYTESTGSTTNLSGGGIFCPSTNAFVANCLITDCHASSYAGGVMGGTIVNSTLLRNTTAESAGGAYKSALLGCHIISNEVFFTENTRIGGGVRSSVLQNCVLQYNQAQRYGAAHDSFLENCLIENNSAAGRSGGIGGSVRGATIAKNCIIRYNKGQYGAGAQNTVLFNCLVVGNSGKFGGGVRDCDLYNCTVVSNYYNATGEPSGLAISGGVVPVIVNTIMVSNYTDGVLANYPAGVEIAFTNSCTYPLPDYGTGNLDADPGFVDFTGGDFHLAAGSPCINAGIDLSDMHVLDDLDGRKRPMQRFYDLGCYEALPPQGTVFMIH